MATTRRVGIAVLLFGGMFIGSALTEQSLIDLTHDIDRDTVFWPTMPKFNMTSLEKGSTRGFWVEFNWFSLSEHGGTHMDAPVHFSKGNWELHQIPLKRFMGPGVIIDLTDRVAQKPDSQILVSDLENWEEKHGKIPSNAFVLLRSDWDQNWPNTNKVFGTQQLSDSNSYRYPTFSIEAGQWLLSNRPYISAIGVDSPGFDLPNTNYPVHQLLLGARIIGLEHIANLGQVPESGATIYALPIKLKGGSGGPMRMFAAVGDGALALTRFSFHFICLLSFVAFYIVSA